VSEVAERVLGGQPGRARLRRPAQTCAAVITAPRTVALREVPLLDPGPDEVRLRMEGCGVCGSNLPIWQGRPWFEYPLLPGEPGHEGWGVVEAAGSEVTAIDWWSQPDRCSRCRARWTACRQRESRSPAP